MIKLAGLPKYQIYFRSTRYRTVQLKATRRQRELELAKQRELERQRLEAQQLAESKARSEAMGNAINGALERLRSYPSLDDKINEQAALFLSQFTCATELDSEHDIREYFGDEKTAADLRKKHSPECQKNSLDIREEIQTLDEAKDPVIMLLAANKMKKFAPKQGILSAEQQDKLLQGLKDVITAGIQNSDMSKFDEEDQLAIKEMVQMVKTAKSTNFGISVKLALLVERLNQKAKTCEKFNTGFIPPVKVRQLDCNDGIKGEES